MLLVKLNQAEPQKDHAKGPGGRAKVQSYPNLFFVLSRKHPLQSHELPGKAMLEVRTDTK